MKNKLFRKALTVFTAMAIAMTFSLMMGIPFGEHGLSVTASAETLGAFEVTGGTNGTDYTYADGVLTINTSAELTIRNVDTQTATTDRIEVADGVSANITLAGVNIDVSGISNSAAFKIADNSTGNVTVTLEDGTTNTLKSGKNCAGLQKNGGTSTGTLTIQGGTEGTGVLDATGGEWAAGIGGGSGGDGSNVTISGGIVTATGSGYCSGIGGGYDGNGYNITISGGVVTATGGQYGAGIGGGYTGVGVGITISGGTVTATGGEGGAGIGGGCASMAGGGEADNITISGGSVKAVGGGANINNIGGGYIRPAVTPTNGTNDVYLFTLANPDSKTVYIDGVEYLPVNHTAIDSTDTNLYVYLTGEEHTVRVGDEENIYTYNSNTGAFEVKQGSSFVITANDGSSLIYGTDYTYPKTTGVLTILSDKAITIANADSVYEADDHINVAKNINANITLAGVYINVSSGAAFAIEGYGKGNVTVTLAKGSVNILQSGKDFAGINKNNDESTLTITGEGSLTAQGGAYAPGIGAEEATSNITIKGGIITATGGDDGAGIGGGHNGTSRNITITGTAVVTATGGDYGAGIGGGRYGTLEDIFITGGSVKASSIGCTPTDGTANATCVYLFEISNPNGEDIVIDGVDFPDKHGDENKIYAYVTAENHTVKVGDTSTLYEYLNGAFTEMVHGTDLSVSATNSGETLVHGVDYTYSSATGILTVLTDKALTIANTNPSTPTTNSIVVADGVSANITLAGVNINAISGAAFTIAENSTGDVTLTLADGSVNTLKGASYYAGLQKNGADENVGTLTICGTGSLSAQGGTDGAGIGGANNRSTGNITISGGVVVTATGGVGSAGIGGGYGGSAEDITITDNAVVTATGDTYGAGIGGGYNGSATDIKISDNAVVTASGKDGGAGIGGGADGTLEGIIINGGSVNAIGSNYYEHSVGGADGANIGGGVTLPSGQDSDPEDGAPVTPTLADGTTPVYLLELDVDGTSAVTINGKAYPTKHIDEYKLYVYLTAGIYTVANGNSQKIYTIADDGTVSGVGTAFTITGTDLVYGTDYTYPADTGVLTILSDKAMTIANAYPTAATTDVIAVAYGVSANITLNGVNINVSGMEKAAFKIADNSTGNVTIILADDSENTLISGNIYAGLQKCGVYICESQGRLTIKGGTKGNGKLTATGGRDGGAGIGGAGSVTMNPEKPFDANTSNILITGGVIVANGGAYGGAGIGSGCGRYLLESSGSQDVSGSCITITGGTVTAIGSQYGGSGIGGGDMASGDHITISGGIVTAIGGDYYDGVGIGGSRNHGIFGDFVITGGSVKANSISCTPTDGTNDVYLLELDVDGTSDVTINGKAYPTKHFDENKVYVYLPAGSFEAPDMVVTGETTILYYDTTGSRWITIVDAPEADDTEFIYNSLEHTYTLTESDCYAIAGNKQTNAGAYTVTVTLDENYVWSDNGLAENKEYAFTILKADLTVTAESYTIKEGDKLPLNHEYTVEGLCGNDTLESINAGVAIGYFNGATAEIAGEYDIILKGKSETANYKITYVNGKLTVIPKDVQTIVAENVTLTYGDTNGKITAMAIGELSYEVTVGDDVISVDDNGNITINKGGVAVVTITAAETYDYKEATKVITVVVNKATVTADMFVYTAPSDLVYDGNAKTPTFTVRDDISGMGAITIRYSADPINVGTYKIYVEVEESDYYKGIACITAASWTFKITKADIITFEAPESKNPTYTNEEQELITSGTAIGGEIQYSLDGVHYSTDIPKGKELGTYVVYYRIIGDSNHNDVAAKTIEVKLLPANVSGLSASALSSTAIRLNWTVDEYVDGCVIVQYVDGQWELIDEVDRSITTYKLTDLTPGTDYQFKLYTYIVTDSMPVYSNYSDVLTVNTLLPSVQGFNNPSRAVTAIRLSWTKNDYADGYIIEQYTNSGWVQIADVNDGDT
ncbi:MAG: fibronectin type III domain-containing protein, partial [Ruminiclostridium sp.]|nr:fibronectin type III domain-containing protein [Ruminiclostridium sp.]